MDKECLQLISPIDATSSSDNDDDDFDQLQPTKSKRLCSHSISPDINYSTNNNDIDKQFDHKQKPHASTTPVDVVPLKQNAGAHTIMHSILITNDADNHYDYNDYRYSGNVTGIAAGNDASGNTKTFDSAETDNFHMLSDELLLAIFRHLPKKALIRCGRVCRRFHDVTLDESLWTRLDLGGRTVRPGALGHIVGRGLVVLRLAQSTIGEPVFDPAETLPDYTSRLQYLDLSMANICRSALLELLQHCRQLRKLSLEHLAVDTRICVQIASNRELEVLNLTMASGLTAFDMRMMFGHLNNLQSLNVAWADLDHECVRSLVESVSRKLQRLNVAGCRKSMTDLMLFHLVRRCPDLIELDLSDCAVLTSDAIGTVCGLKRLEYLSLSRCYNIAVSAYLSINELISLVYLDIFGVLSDQALTMLQSSFPKVNINKFLHSAVARPTVAQRRTSVWGQRTRD